MTVPHLLENNRLYRSKKYVLSAALAVATISLVSGFYLRDAWASASMADVVLTDTMAPSESFGIPLEGVYLAPLPEETFELSEEERSKRLALASSIAERFRISRQGAEQIVEAAHDVGEQYDVDPIILLSVAAVESRFNPYAESSVGAVGLMQILPRAHPEKIAAVEEAGESLLDPEISLRLGAQVYSEYARRFRGDVELTLQQYNGALNDQERRYSRRVLGEHRRFQNVLSQS